MAAPRFYHPLPLEAGADIALPEALAHHAIRVLRLTDGADILLFDGHGAQYPATLHIEGKKGRASLGQAQTPPTELNGNITVLQGIAAGDKMDWIIEKSVELGVRRFVPIRARRSVLQLNAERQAKRLVHWQRVIESASEQCGRNRLMELAEPVTLAEYWQQAAQGLHLFCDPDAEQTLAQTLAPEHHDVVLLIGPEGGWAEQERASAVQAQARAIRFGHRVLRTETAALALTSAISALQGWE
ncbi:16S rRNA (uracil(1498)-N(3))-methyltransferase [Alcaligenes sp. SDU_A2]|uniref:16S rRNA (uracil(1498)-N(3))-methyltransferase n=1 Tax=Alcaligenes sp. SDU_A2 TaxID=3136634 RepID=UPI00311F5B66